MLQSVDSHVRETEDLEGVHQKEYDMLQKFKDREDG